MDRDTPSWRSHLLGEYIWTCHHPHELHLQLLKRFTCHNHKSKNPTVTKELLGY